MTEFSLPTFLLDQINLLLLGVVNALSKLVFVTYFLDSSTL